MFVLFLPMSQIRGSCGHLKASWDNHPSCLSCSHCSFESRCGVCKLWMSSVWTLAVNRRTYDRRKSSGDTMGKKGAASGSGTAPKQSVTVSKQSQSENASQTSASGKKYRENRETSPKDTRGSTEFFSVRYARWVSHQSVYGQEDSWNTRRQVRG